MTEEVLLDLLLKTPAAERDTLLNRLCDGRPELRVWLELQLLTAADSLTDRSIPDSLVDPRIDRPVPSIDDQSGKMIGPYKLLHKLGEGGMGTVWGAEQTQPVKRKVALKLIKGGMDSSQVISRFEAERQALALMDHPSIARIYDAGRTAHGRPYFAMELVKGVPITKYCDEVQASLEDRLKLFAEVCAAVQHAHSKGVIHRDLKPSNVLVAMQDGNPTPKVIDFGLAKALNQSLADRSMETEIGQVVGTLEYMAPEQAELSALDVDTRADVYALGVLLYELLVGSTPIGKERLRQSAFAEILRVIKEEEPQRPSTRLSHSKASVDSLAAVRRMDPKRLRSELKGELDWIVLKALEKDRTRRYETANAFKRDIERYLADEPVDAKPPSTSYRIGKFVRRNRLAVAAAGIVAVTLVIGVAGLSLGLVEANRARSAEANRAEGERKAKLDAEEQKEKALRAAAAEEVAKGQALKRLAQVEKGNEVLSAIFADLDVRRVRADDEPLEAVLAKRLVNAAAQFKKEALGDPLAEAKLESQLGASLINLGYPADAIPLYTKSLETRKTQLGPFHPLTLESMSGLSLACYGAGKMDKSLPLMEETFKLRKANLGEDDLDTLLSMNVLATGLIRVGKPDEALPLLVKAYDLRKAKLGDDHADSLTSLSNLAEGYRAVGKLDKAVPLMEEAYRLRKETLGADHPDTLLSLNNLASGYQQTKRLKKAIPLMEEVYRLRKEKLGADHPAMLTSWSNLALAYIEDGKRDEGTRYLEDILRIRRVKLGNNHSETILSIFNLATTYRDAGKQNQALELLEEASREIEKQKYQDERARWIIPTTCDAYETANQFDKAEPWRRKWVAVVKSRSGTDSKEYLNELVDLAWNLLKQKKWADSEPFLREVVALRERKQPDVWSTFYARSMLGESLLEQKKYTEAEPLLLSGYKGLKQRRKSIPAAGGQRIFEAVDRIIRLYTVTNKPDQVSKWKEERVRLTVTPAKESGVSNPKK